MPFITSLFDINTTMFTVFSYSMSYLEFVGTIFTIWCVWLTSKAKILSWPIGLLGSVLYLVLFYQIQLYSDVFEQVYFLITGVAGWYLWLKYKKDINQTNKTVIVGVNKIKQNSVLALIIIVGTAVMSYFTINLSSWLPQYFPNPVSLPILDAFTTVMSFVAQWLLMKKKLESWVLWILIDAIDIGLYWYKGVKFVSLEYLLFFFIAIFGLINWLKIYKNNK
jgi:nicotinamide mononucleotide transporter